MQTATYHNPFRQQLIEMGKAIEEAKRDHAQAELGVFAIARGERMTADAKDAAYRTLKLCQDRLRAAIGQYDETFEQFLEWVTPIVVDEEAAIADAGADAVATAEKIIAAARMVSERNAIADRAVTVWMYDKNPDLPHCWNGERMTAATAARAIAERSAAGKPRVTRTWEGYTSFAFAGGSRVVVKGATADELRDAYLAAVAA